METKVITKAELKKELNKVINFSNKLYFNLILDGLVRGRSVVVNAVSYIGAGEYTRINEKGRYKYKMIVPIISKCGELYSTDLYKDNVKFAIDGEYRIYHTQQKVVDVICEIPADFSENRMGHGYTQEKYGYYKMAVKIKPKNKF